MNKQPDTLRSLPLLALLLVALLSTLATTTASVAETPEDADAIIARSFACLLYTSDAADEK